MRVALLVVAGCASGRAPAEPVELLAPEVAIETEDYAVARAHFTTHLTREGPSPQPYDPVEAPPGVERVEYAPGLAAWLGGGDRGGKSPAVVFVHGGFAFGADDWAQTAPFRDAGFVVLAPMLRGENGQPGAFSFVFDELTDVLAAAAYLRDRPDVDAGRLYVAGVSSGGTLALLAAQSSPMFRAAASASASPDQVLLAHHTKPGDLPFDPGDRRELVMRSPLAFAASFKCPTRIYYGLQDHFVVASRRTAEVAQHRGLDVVAVAIPGDHGSSVAPAIAQTVAFFRGH
jgi:dipeptidyl aminopeptidase/acylaminoacyl peptidase